MRSLISINFPAPDMEPESRRFRKKAQDAQDAVLRFLKFSVFSRADKVFEFFVQWGLGKGPEAGGHQGPAIIPPKALRIFVRICSQVPAKVQSVLLVACVTEEARTCEA